MNDVIRKLLVYIDRPIIVHAGYYDFCMEEEHPHHGHTPSDDPRYRAAFPIVLKGFKVPTGRWRYLDQPPCAQEGQPDVAHDEPLQPERVAVYGIGQGGNELAIPFNARTDEACGFSCRVIMRITSDGEVLFEPQITDDPTKDLFEYQV